VHFLLSSPMVTTSRPPVWPRPAYAVWPGPHGVAPAPATLLRRPFFQSRRAASQSSSAATAPSLDTVLSSGPAPQAVLDSCSAAWPAWARNAFRLVQVRSSLARSCVAVASSKVQKPVIPGAALGAALPWPADGALESSTFTAALTAPASGLIGARAFATCRREATPWQTPLPPTRPQPRSKPSPSALCSSRPPSEPAPWPATGWYWGSWSA
jgi:hypothetical protein